MTEHNHKSYKFLDAITIAFTVFLIIGNLAGSVKIIRINLPIFDWGFSCTAGLLLFPVTYLIGDLLTEIYGYDKSRKVIWSGFGGLLLANLIIQFYFLLPADPNWGLGREFETVFKQSFRLSMASMVAFFCGEFTNSYIVAKLKIKNAGRNQALRLILSTVAGELVDTVIVLFLGFYGAQGYPVDLIYRFLVTNYLFKISWEIIAYPIITKPLISYIKKAENEDYYDYKTDMNPFHI